MSFSNDSDEEDYKALVVDDKEDVCLVIEAHLCQNGFKSHNIDKAFNAQTALNLLNSNQYFFIFLDVRLPDMDGTTLIDEIRKAGSKNKDAVLMMSSGENLDEIIKEFLNQNLLKEKIDIFLLKPFTQKDCDNYFDIDYMLKQVAKKKSKS
jgi:CheY-like chemotaxis protein